MKKVLGDALSYSKKRADKGVPWEGGALYLPRTEWSAREAWDMSRQLICWMLWAEENGKGDLARQVSNNLRDLSWRNGIGFRQGGSGKDWARGVGKEGRSRRGRDYPPDRHLHGDPDYAVVGVRGMKPGVAR